MRVICLIGARGVGKTTVSQEMLKQLPEWSYQTLHENEGGWAGLCERVHKLTSGCVVEVPTIPPVLRAVLQSHDTTIVRVTCSERERWRRLRARGVHHIDPANNPLSHVRFDATRVEPAGVQKLVELARKKGVQKIA